MTWVRTFGSPGTERGERPMRPRLPPRRRSSLPRPSKGNRARVQSPATRAGASVPLPGTRAPSGARAPRAGRGTMRAAGTGQPQRPPDRMRVLIPRPLRGQRAAAERAPMNWLNEVLNNDPDPAESQEWIEYLKRSDEHTAELTS